MSNAKKHNDNEKSSKVKQISFMLHTLPRILEEIAYY